MGHTMQRVTQTGCGWNAGATDIASARYQAVKDLLADRGVDPVSVNSCPSIQHLRRLGMARGVISNGEFDHVVATAAKGELSRRVGMHHDDVELLMAVMRGRPHSQQHIEELDRKNRLHQEKELAMYKIRLGRRNIDRTQQDFPAAFR